MSTIRAKTATTASTASRRGRRPPALEPIAHDTRSPSSGMLPTVVLAWPAGPTTIAAVLWA
jgi:hypothetical protein